MYSLWLADFWFYDELIPRVDVHRVQLFAVYFKFFWAIMNYFVMVEESHLAGWQANLIIETKKNTNINPIVTMPHSYFKCTT